MKKMVLVAFGLAGLVCAGHVGAAQAAAAPAYVDENSQDPAPLKLTGVDGVVHGLGGDPMPRVTIALFTEQGHTLLASVMSGKDGKFKFDKVDKGFYRVVAHVDGLCTANIPIQVESSLLRRKLVITMQPKDIDTCSYGMAKK
jgi:hypothetical protein